MTIKVSVLLAPSTQAPELAVAAEQAGFETVWILDSPPVFGDPFVSLAAAAVATTSIRLATGVINTVTRTSMMAAVAFASLNAYAPGRITCGLGVGHTGANAMGLPIGRLADLAPYVGELRGLLEGREIVRADGLHQQLLGKGMPFFDFEERVPVYIASAGKRSLPLAATIADGIILGGITDPGVIAHARSLTTEAAAGAARPAPRLAITPSAYLSETAMSFEELREAIGPKSLAPARNFAPVIEEVHGAESPLSRHATRIRTEAYADVPRKAAEGERREHLETYRTYITELTDAQRDLITPEVLAATSVAGTPEQWIERLVALEAAGIDEVILSPLPQFAARTIELCGRLVLPALEGATR